ncbi:MAG: Unknown protein [uncultured Sulfurovum sp.]|uniref:histidine kinase n=1 Tax=uncultured Sulfurovum sp. TaxID=269237 RepID=A0A6S6TEL5_9BACT|nr:MAG: Unknown protein [uncultured Sulfurovum sp.]
MRELEVNQLLIKQVQDVYGKDFDFKKLDEKVQALLKNVNSSYNNLGYQIKQNNVLFEEEENIVFTIGLSAGVLRANKKFYQTFGFEDLTDFKNDYSCICELFIQDEGYLKETTVQSHWTKPVRENPHKRHKALLRNFQGDKRVYAVLLKEVTLEDATLNICTFTDITELEEAINISRKSEEIKTAFMANMSHEIRTPMNGIIGFTNLLLETELSVQQKQFLELIEESSGILNKIVDDILDFSKIENGSLELDFSNVNVFTDFYSMISQFKTEALEKSLSYRVDIDPNISESLMMDKNRIIKILSNLISNAVKFTSEGGEIYIDIQLLKSSQDKELISFSVTDTGIGISQNDLHSIFKSFIQADSSFSKQFGGTGMGLSISRSLCHLMQSDLNVKSTPQQGSTFSFKIDFKRSSVENRLSTRIKERTIYLVQNSNRDCDYACYQLEHFGIDFIKISKDELLTSNTKESIVILFDYKEFLPLSLDEAGILLIDTSSEAGLYAKEFKNIYHIGSFIEFPSELYSAMLDSDTALNLGRKNKHFNLNVLVAEDSRVNRVLLDEMLQEYDINADFVEDGEKAVHMALKNSYNLILMDINMPNLNGVEANKILKDKGLGIPIVAVTANALRGDRERLLDLGLDDYLSKPISVDSLYNILLKYN